ncbi:MAG: selenocysteine-specific translation elongation factor [Deltaproteobacteria bacterium]|nr:selenocysteine-specific translation elongation factor [Deltaproteobacteria bacterium]
MQKHITVGIAGHVDHGKTSLVRCLTGIDTDRLEEEKRRGLSIESGIAPFELESGTQIALVDVPEHTDFLKNTIRGLSSVDMALLVVAADDGIMPQTREHLQILEFFNAKDGFVVLSKVDLADEEVLELAELEISETLENSFLGGESIIRFSALDRQGLTEIRGNIEEIVRKVPGKHLEAPFRLWIDQVKSFPGYGTIVSGTILSGRLRQDDPLQLLPSGIETRARSMETHHKSVAEAWAGQRVGINLHKVPLTGVERGMALAEPGTVRSSYLLNVDLHVLPGTGKPIKNRQRVKLYLGTSVTSTRVILMDKEQLEPGESGLAQLRLMKPIGALPGDPFVVCPLNIQTTIAGGKVLEVPQQKYRRGKASMMVSYLKALQGDDIKGYLTHAMKSNPNHLVKTIDLARNTGCSVKEMEEAVKELAKDGEVLSFKGSGFLGKEQYRELKEVVQEAVERILKQDPLKTNVKADEIRFQVAPSLDDLPFQRMLGELCNEGKLLKVDGGFRSQNLSVDLPHEQQRIVSLILDSDLVE